MNYPNLENEKIIALDIETVDPDIIALGCGVRRNGYILGVGIATKNKQWYINKLNANFYNWLRTLQNTSIVGANIIYDLDYLQYQNINFNKIHDIQIAEPLINENKKSYSLDSLAIEYLGEHKKEEELINFCKNNKLKGKPQQYLKDMPPELVAKYCKADCRQTLEIFLKQYHILKKQELIKIYDIERGLIPLLLQMKKTGVRIDIEKLNLWSNKYLEKIKSAQIKLNRLCGFECNIYENETIKKAFDKFKYEYNYTVNGNPCFNSNFLKSQNHNLAKYILNLRHLLKIQSTYLEGMKKYLIADRLHCDFNLLRSDNFGTVTGRFSSSKPNLQNIPKNEIRELFIPEKNHKWCRFDYNQEEMVIFAHYALGDSAEKLRDMYIKDEKADLYKIFASLGLHKKINSITKEERKKFKKITLGVLYGMATDSLGRQLGIITKIKPIDKVMKQFWENKFKKNGLYKIDKKYKAYLIEYLKAWKIMDSFNKQIPCLKETTKKAQEVCDKKGFVRTILNRRRRLEKKYSYKAFNAVDQGTAGDIMKASMLEAYKEKLFNVFPLHLTVHDEIDFSYNNDEFKLKQLIEIFENTIKLKVPLRIDCAIGENWNL